MNSPDSYLQEDLGPKLTAINTTCIVLATLAVVCRFTARYMKSTGWWWDDWTALLSLIWAWAFYGVVQSSIPYGLGRHIEVVSESHQVIDMKLLYVYQIFYCLIPVTIKISALFLYRRVFVIKGFIQWINAIFAVLMAWGIASIIVDIFNCTPVNAFWMDDDTKCVDLQAWVLGYAIPGIVLDFVVWLTPIPLIWKLLKLSLYHKICLTIVFVIGLTDCAVDIARLVIITSYFEEKDFTYLYASVQWWNMLHTSLGIIAICLPTMRILLNWVGAVLSRHSQLSSGTQHSMANRKSRWDKNKTNYDELNEAGISLVGEAGRNVHNNAIALALREQSEGTTLHSLGDKEIQVTRDVMVESASPPAIPSDAHVAGQVRLEQV